MMTTEINPKINISDPKKPNMCIGLTPNLDRNHKVIKSRYPLKKRFSPPNLVFPEFACLMVHYLFSDFREAGIFCQIGDVAVHFTVYFDVLDHVPAIGFEPAIEVVQVVDADTARAVALKSLVGMVFDKGS